MDNRIQELIDLTKLKFGLGNYNLQSHSINRRVNIFNDTVYTLCMEWFPNHVTEHEDDGLNPEGTAVIEIDVNSRNFESAIFVMGKTYANDGVLFTNRNMKEIIKWIEQETGLTYGKQLQLQKEEEGELLFKECIDDVAVTPSGFIEIKFDQEGRLTYFANHGQFPSKEMVNKETYTLSLEMLGDLLEKQLKLIEFPLFEQEKLLSVYAVEEIYVTNDGTSVIPFEFIIDVKSYSEINKIIYWDEPSNKPFERIEISWTEDITVEQAFSNEPSPDEFPITNVEQEKCVIAVKDFLRQEYPNETGKWILKTLHRDKGYIHATLRANHQDNRVFQRKINVMIDAKSLQAVNYMDNKPMLEIYEQFQAPDKVKIDKKEAYEKIKEFLELKPYYVYDFKQKQYVLCGKLDCQYGVNASSGQVIALEDL